jgi:hypothetical protein
MPTRPTWIAHLAAVSLLLCWILARLPGLLAADDVIWVEGESATTRQVTINSWYDGQIKKDLLSGGAWLTNFGSPDDGTAAYQVTVATAGTYFFWVRCNPIGSALSYQINGGAPVEIDMSHPVDTVNLASNDAPDLRFLAWVKAGSVTLPAGVVTVAFRMHSANSHHGAIDCFLFSPTALTPSGKTKPGQKLGSDEAGWFAFEPGHDALAAPGALDLSYLNEKLAGGSGFLKAVDNEFQLGDGTPVRFWSANVASHGVMGKEDAEVDHLAARLAKNGFNMVRLHGPVFDRSNPDPTQINPAQLKRLQAIVSIFNHHGIYCLLSTYYPLWLTLQDTDGIAGSAIGKNPFAILFFEPRFQEMYHAWLKATLTTKDPISGKSLSENPGVGIVEINNEDNLFFWTFSAANIGPGPLHTFEGMFSAYLEKKYGSIAAAQGAWPGIKHPHDDPSGHVMGIYDAWNFTAQGMANPAMKARMTDQIDFMAQTQHDFYATTARWLRDTCGVKCPITASNWTTADNATLGVIDRWTYTAAGVIDKHGYFGGAHAGPRAGFMVAAGDTYEDRCALLDPGDVPIGYYQIAHYPNIHSEIAWNKPNRFIADSDLMMSTYAAIQGINSFFIFVTDSGEWTANGNGVWTLMMPGEFGQSPACALQFRRGDLGPAVTVRRYVNTVKDLLALKGSGFAEGTNKDFSAQSHPQAGNPGTLADFDPLTYFVGRVECSFLAGDHPIAVDLTALIDHAAKTVTSANGEAKLNYAVGLLTVDSPKSQAASGFLAKAGAITLKDVTITSAMEYGSVQVISLDDRPLSQSQRILVQSFSEEKMDGFKATGKTIDDVGHTPILVKDISGTVSLTGGGTWSAVALDGNGYPEKTTVVMNAGVLTLPSAALYVELTRAGR